jgi:hypothetical protein
MLASPQQLGFGFDEIEEQKETAHLPSAVGEGTAHYRTLLEQHHQAMLAGDEKTALAIRSDANRLAVKLNGNDIAILGDADAPGYALMRETAAPKFRERKVISEYSGTLRNGTFRRFLRNRLVALVVGTGFDCGS